MVARWGLRKRGWKGSNTLLYGRGAISHLSASVHGVESEIGFDLRNLVPRLKPRLRAKSPRHKGKCPAAGMEMDAASTNWLFRRRLRYWNGGIAVRRWYLVGGKQGSP